ncbi:hypothetical protein EYF80_038571 [Liparis tanakae]|uniref:Uncharacterized protein n=1 Tax=Liparis tanakae TaxID=230148 RepID=A0A4Z2GDI0_9TELE|nr:hypothetical protein EYF80_038571 [Liparis tanakae]
MEGKKKNRKNNNKQEEGKKEKEKSKRKKKNRRVPVLRRLPNVKTCNSKSLAIFSRNALQCGRSRVCSIGSPRPSWKWKIP